MQNITIACGTNLGNGFRRRKIDIIVVGNETYRHNVARSLEAEGFIIYKENNIPVSAIKENVNVYFFKEDVRLVQAWSATLWILDPSSKDQRLKEEILIRQNSAAALIGYKLEGEEK